MLKIVTIIGARPQIIKAAAISRAIKISFSSEIKEIIVHTGQHYDNNMSGVFFEELEIPAPDVNLQVGSGSHGKQTAEMITGIENVLIKEKPACLVIYGDTNSTLAGAVAASKLLIPIVHIEAGLRSFNKQMPEEVNRIMADHVSTLLFAPTKTAVANLEKEGFNITSSLEKATINQPLVYHCGDIMYDNSLYFSMIAEQKSDIISTLNLASKNYILCTIHRNANTDDSKKLTALFSVIDKISREKNQSVVLPLHPRTSNVLEEMVEKTVLENVKKNNLIKIIPPVSFFEMIVLEKNCSIVMTDSGGVQKEAFFFKKPCIILRPETEWVELVQCGSAIVTDVDPERIITAFESLTKKTLEYPPIFGDGKAAEFICKKLVENLS